MFCFIIFNYILHTVDDGKVECEWEKSEKEKCHIMLVCNLWLLYDESCFFFVQRFYVTSTQLRGRETVEISFND